MFRFFRKVIKSLENTTPSNALNFAYIKLIEDRNHELAESCGELLWSIYKGKIEFSKLSCSEKDLAYFLHSLEYILIDETKDTVLCNVPVFERVDNQVINEISELILSDICNVVKTALEDFEKNASDLTPIKHKVNIKEVSIELWHQVFGFTNEYLVEQNFVEKPLHRKGEGRYLRSFGIKD
jgi:hypothetical protein